MKLCKANVDIDVMSRFQHWIQQKLQITLTRGWDEIILFHSADELEAIQYFWQLFDEFISQDKSSY
jgi:hypothetical protein